MKQDPNNYWEQLERLEKLIRSSELKAGAIFSFHSLILGLFFDRFDQVSTIFSEGTVYVILALLWVLFVLVSIFFCFLCFKPQIEFKYDDNVFFYQDAAHAFGNTVEYTKRLMEVCANEDELFKQLGEQIHAESKIIDKKFKHVHNAIKFFGLSVLVVILINALYILQAYI
ncbi:hypothetical protein A9Q87_08155 [Flavobacteriales bacterium 34_180_T64]|nr:hypothetical protein A9Q87_08155 [Flavobacteriales bacterium 34_180_T64]